MPQSRQGGSRKAPPPPVVYVCGPEVGDELRHSLRSLAAHVPHGDVWIAGHRPSWVTNVGHIPNRQDGTKFDNALGNLRAACESSEVPSRFVLWNDDFFALRRTTPAPKWHRGVIRDIRRQNPNRIRRQSSHFDGLAGTAWVLARWGFHEPKNYELHVPMSMDGPTMLEALDRAVPFAVPALHPRTLFGNVAQVGGTEHGDVKIPHRHPPKIDGPWVSTNEHSFTRGTVGEYLRGQFPDPSPYEREGG